jgi:hypothetical protein
MSWLILWIALVQGLAVSASLFALSSAAGRWLRLEPWQALFAGLCALGVAGFIQFWATFVGIGLTVPVQIVFGAIGVALLAFAVLRGRSGDIELIAPCVLVFGASVVLTCWSFVGAKPEDLADPLRFITTRWTSPISSDNEIPWVFAEQLRQAQITTPFYGNWLSSDRPPLETGLYLLLNQGDGGRLWYQGCGVALQLTSLAAVWAVARAAGADRRWALLTALAVLLTPFAITNGSYVWPKLLAAAYVCGAFALHMFSDRTRPLVTGAIAGLAAALAMLAHGSSAFALVGIAIIAVIARNIGSVRYIAAGVVCAVALYAPWVAYQRYYDPPGDRLLKWHLAGVIEPTDRPFLRTLSDSYGTLNVASWTGGRIRNIAGIAGVPNPNEMPATTMPGMLPKIRDYVFGIIGAGMGLFGLALYGSPALLAPKQTRMLSGAAIATLLVWALLMFSPGQTMTKNGSYFPQLALIIAVMMLLSSTPLGRRIGIGILVVQALFVGGLYGLG